MTLLSFNRRGRVWPKWWGWVLGLGVLVMLGVWGAKRVGFRSDAGQKVAVSAHVTASAGEVPPLLGFASRGMVVTPLQRDKQSEYANVVVSHLPKKTTQLVFDGDVSIAAVALFDYNEEPFLEVLVADEDSNGDGNINAHDIHQVVWVSLDRMESVKVEYPRMHVKKLVGAGRMLLSDGDKREYARVYQVAVDTNQNGQIDGADPTQWVAISLADRVLHAFLPSPEIPGQLVVTASAQVAIKKATSKLTKSRSSRPRTKRKPAVSADGVAEGGDH